MGWDYEGYDMEVGPNNGNEAIAQGNEAEIHLINDVELDIGGVGPPAE